MLCDLFILRGATAHIRSDNGPSSPPRLFGTASQRSGARLPTSNQAVLWKTVIARASTQSFTTSYLMANSSTRSTRPRGASTDGGTLHHDPPESSPGYRPPAPQVGLWTATQCWTNFAGHPSRGAKARHPLTSKTDHLSWARQWWLTKLLKRKFGLTLISHRAHFASYSFWNFPCISDFFNTLLAPQLSFFPTANDRHKVLE